MIRYKVGDMPAVFFDGYNTANGLDDMIMALLAERVSAPAVTLSFGVRYVLPEPNNTDWKFLTYITGTRKSGEQFTVGVCDYEGPASYGQILFSRER